MFTDWEILCYKDVKSLQIGFVVLDKLILKYLYGNANGIFIANTVQKNEK